MSAYDLLPCDHSQHVSARDCYYAHERLRIEERMIRSLIRRLKREGWRPTRVNDGGDELISVATERQALDAIFSVDEAALGFSKGSAHHSVYIVLGNGGDCIADWGYAAGDVDGFDAVMDRITDELWKES